MACKMGTFSLAVLSVIALVAMGVRPGPLMAQEADTSHVSTSRLALFGAVTAGAMVIVHFQQQQAWWNGPKGSFWLYNDWKFARGVDKIGHVYGAYVASTAFREGFRWCGLSERSSRLVGV